MKTVMFGEQKIEFPDEMDDSAIDQIIQRDFVKTPQTLAQQPIQPASQQPEPQRNIFGGKATLSNIADVAKGIVETPLSIATGMVAAPMGVGAGIVGTALKGDVAGKQIREDVTNKFTYQPTSETGKGAMDLLGKATYPLTLPRQAATSLGGEQWGNVADVAMMSLLPKIPSAIRAGGDIPYNIGKFLYRKNLAPPGGVEASEALTRFGYTKNLPVTSAGWGKLKTGDMNYLKRRANQLLAANEGKTAKFETMIQPIRELKERYAKFGTEKPETHVRMLQNIEDQMTRTWLEEFPDGNIPVNRMQDFKYMLYDRSKNAQGELQLSMGSEGRKSLAHGAMESIETAIPELGPVNRQLKPYLEFEEALDKAIPRLKNEKFSITNSIFNNNYIMGKLAQVFKKISPDHPFADRNTLKLHLLKTASPAVIDFNEAFAPEQPNWGGTSQTTTNIPNQGFTTYPPYNPPAPTKPLMLGYEPVSTIRGKGMTPDIWSKPEAPYPSDIMDIVGQRKGKVQIMNKDLMDAMLREIRNRQPSP
jgi:hypothetical protein